MKKLFLFVSLALSSLHAFAQGTAFTYQGRLNDGANPANGIYDLSFALFDAASVGTQQGYALTNIATAVSNGLFTVALDFGNQFPGTDRWLEIGVRTNGGGAFSALSPRQQLTSTPYAVYAGSANAAGLTGTIAATNIADGTITSNLLASGSVSVNQLSTNIGVWTRAGSNVFYNAGNVGIGTNNPRSPLWVQGNGADGASGTLTAVQTSGGSGSGAVIGICLVPGGNGVVGFSDVLLPNVSGPNAANFGVWGKTSTTNGTGVAGHATASTGLTYGVFGQAPSLQGYAGYFDGRGYFSGNVGIGAASPAAPLHVVGNNAFPQTKVAAGSNAPYGSFLSLDATATAGGKDYLIYSTGAAAGEGRGKLVVQNYTDGVISMAIQTNGNVGIGTLNPAARLQVQGTTINGGAANSIAKGISASTIAGGGVPGFPNTILAESSFIGAGNWNTINSNLNNSAIVAGYLNNIYSLSSFIGSGNFNTIQTNSPFAVIGGGFGNLVSGEGATVPGGEGNTAAGYDSFAAGTSAQALHSGSFVWADGSGVPFSSTANNQFLIRAAGGVGIGTSTPTTALQVNGTVTATSFAGNGASLSGVARLDGGNNLTGQQTLANSGYGYVHSDGVREMSTYLDGNGGWFGTLSNDPLWFFVHDGWASMAIATNGNVGINTTTPGYTLEVNGSAHRVDNSASWTTTSDRRLKQDIASIGNGLELVRQLRPVDFRYTEAYRAANPGLPATEQYGVIAQEFQQVFPDFVQTNSAGYLTVNPSPLTFVNTAAIKELNEKLEEQKAENAELKKSVAELKRLVEKLTEKK